MKMLKMFPFFFFFVLLLSSCQTPEKGPEANAPTKPSVSKADLPGETLNMEVDEKGLSKMKAVIQTEKGEIVFRFYPKVAPQTVAQLTSLIQKGFYNGLAFHRVVPEFVIQGGDPTGTGAGGSGKNIPAEFSTSLKHAKGSVAMARTQDPNSADSQFYIALDNLPHLDGQYTIFGQVTEGMDVLAKVAQGDKMLKVELVTP